MLRSTPGLPLVSNKKSQVSGPEGEIPVVPIDGHCAAGLPWQQEVADVSISVDHGQMLTRCDPAMAPQKNIRT